jgi:hypothetical protein
MRRQLKGGGYTVVLGEELKGAPPSGDPSLTGFELEQMLMQEAGANIIIVGSEGSSMEMGQIIHAGELACGRTLVLEFRELRETYSAQGVAAAAKLGAMVVRLSRDSFCRCDALTQALDFVRRMHDRHNTSCLLDPRGGA